VVQAARREVEEKKQYEGARGGRERARVAERPAETETEPEAVTETERETKLDAETGEGCVCMRVREGGLCVHARA
jgi:hypothetical protein